MADTFGTHSTLDVGGRSYQIARLGALEKAGLSVARLPYSLRILLENLLRHEDGASVPASDIEALAKWEPRAEPNTEIAYRPGRVLLQDFTGVPAVVDLAAMRDALQRLGGDPGRINPLQPAELVIDHSVQVDVYLLLSRAGLLDRLRDGCAVQRGLQPQTHRQLTGWARRSDLQLQDQAREVAR